jgi:hypothetical protein
MATEPSKRGWARRAAKWIASSRGRRAAIVLSVLVSLPALSVGFMHDDFLHRTAHEGTIPGFQLPAHELYDFTQDPSITPWMIEYGYLPWFTDPELEIRFFRPIAGWLLGLEMLFGRNALIAHVHSILWLFACVVAASFVHRRALRRTTATIATLVYGIAGAHAITTGWIAGRHTLVAAAFGAAAVAAHLVWRERSRRSAVWFSLAALLLGLATSETALGAVAFVVCYELLVPREPIRARALAALPAVGLSLGYLAFYTLAHYGARHSAAYISPFHDPLAFARAIVERLPVLAGELYGAIPSDLALIGETSVPLAVFGVVMTLSCALLVARAKLDPAHRRRLLWLGTSSLLSLVPTVGGVIGSRLVPLALVGSSAIVAAAIVETWRTAGRGARGFGLRAAVIGIVFLHLVLSPLVRVSQPPFLAELAKKEERYAREADLTACDGRDLAYLLSGADPVNSLYGAPILHFYTPEKVAHLRHARVLSLAPHGLMLRVVGDDRFELRIEGRPRRATIFENVYRDTPLEPGMHIDAGELGITVLEAENGYFTRALFEVEGGLDRVCFAEWRGARLRAFSPPPVGQERVVVHELGPMGL